MRKITLSLALFLCLSKIPLPSQEAESFPPLEPLFLYEAEGLSGEDIIRAGLEFSLCPQDSEAGRAALAQFASLEEEMESQDFRSLPEEERGEKVLSLMYARVLKQYSLNQTYIDVMFQKGTYNCVSSSILYAALAKSAGLVIHGVETPNHAFCTLYLGDGRKIDVETTNPNGFNPGTKKQVSSTEKSTRYYVVPKKYYSNRAEVGERKFISLVGKNVMAYLDERRDYGRAVPLGAARIVFVGGSPETDARDVRRSFDIAVLNYAVMLDRQKKSALALDWLDAVESRWGRAEIADNIQKTYDSAANNCAVNLTRAGKARQAQEQFELREEKISPKMRGEIRSMIFLAIVDEETKSRSPEDAISYIQGLKGADEAQGKAVAKRLFELEEYYWSQRARPLSDAGRYLEAAAVMDEGLQSLPTSRNLQTIKNQNLNNYAVTVHNQFVDFYNAKDYENAERVAREGLAILPKNATLQRDLKLAQSRK